MELEALKIANADRSCNKGEPFDFKSNVKFDNSDALLADGSDSGALGSIESITKTLEKQADTFGMTAVRSNSTNSQN